MCFFRLFVSARYPTDISAAQIFTYKVSRQSLQAAILRVSVSLNTAYAISDGANVKSILRRKKFAVRSFGKTFRNACEYHMYAV